ncbi:MAG: hypothetical protein QG637_1119 [Chloroflexota bacterium]|nr:hypothetical protein [Chloroflexota bacterium]
MFSKLDDEMLAIDAQAGYYYSLNESAGRVWEMIAEPVAVGAVCAQLRREFAVAPEACTRDVLGLLQGLHDAGLVQVQG